MKTAVMSPNSRHRMCLIPFLTVTYHGNLLMTVLHSSIHRLTAILTSHFLLELQEAERLIVKLDPGDTLHSSRNPWDSAPSFISSLGGFVNPALSAQSEDDDGIDLQVRSHSKISGEEDEAQVEVPEAAASVPPSLTA